MHKAIISDEGKLTKRELLSLAMSILDPIGVIANYLLNLKLRLRLKTITSLKKIRSILSLDITAAGLHARLSNAGKENKKWTTMAPKAFAVPEADGQVRPPVNLAVLQVSEARSK